MDQRVEAEHQIDGAGVDHVERTAVVHEELQIRAPIESFATHFDAAARQVDADQPVTVVGEVLSPPPMAGSDLQHRGGGQQAAQSWEQAPEPLRVRAAPTRRPLVALEDPVVAVVSRCKVLLDTRHGPSSNRPAADLRPFRNIP